jgi:thiol-disulfide isomerase/thioredoxin
MAVSLAAQGPKPQPPGTISPREQEDLNRTLAAAGSGSLEYLQALERQIQKYPDSSRRPQLEHEAARMAIQRNDYAKTILYGESALARNQTDTLLLEGLCRALLATDSADNSERALKYAMRYEAVVQQQRRQEPASRTGAGGWQDGLDRMQGQAYVYQARANGNLGRAQEAVGLAQRAFQIYPNAESAREIARWEERLEGFSEAVEHLADAFTIPDQRATEESRARDRIRMGELYRKVHGSEAGLGDLALHAYDRNLALIRARELRLRGGEANAGETDPMRFTISGTGGEKLSLDALKGKVVVLDFWATWCAPCRDQHPLLEKAKEAFRNRQDVVFLSISADDNRDAVAGFLAEQHWDDKVYFEDGLSRAFQVDALPTTLIIDRRGTVFSRMDGFSPGAYLGTLTERIEGALKL